MSSSKNIKKLNFDDYYILCICEGYTECAIMDILLDNNKLIFDKDNLIGKKVHKRMTSQKLIDNFLQWDYSKELLIFRILDSRAENLRLRKPYDRYKIFNFYTPYEIEFVFINYDNLFNEFQKEKSKLKASEFYKKYNKKYKKSYSYAIEYLSDIDKLCHSLKKSKRKNELGIFDLLI